MSLTKNIFFSSITLILSSSCTKDKGNLDYTPTGFPQEIGNIIVNNCATSGCHDDISKGAAGGLSLETWDKIFEGSRGGAVVIPYRPDFSTLIYYTNSYNEFGTIQLIPKMPLNAQQLTKEEMQLLYNWVLSGAPDSKGSIKFSASNTEKVYVSNQGCDEITVFDAKSGLAIRYVKVGVSAGTEAPHMVKVAPNNQFWCVCFLAGEYFQKYSTLDNSLLGQVNVGFGSWNTFVISSDSQKAYLVDWGSNGRIAVIDLQNMTAQIISGLIFPHGSALDASSDTLYVTAQTGNFIYKIPVNDFGNIEEISMNSNPPSSANSLNIHEIIFSPDNSKYFVTCQGSNEVRIIMKSNDSLMAVIPVGIYPQEMGVSSVYPYLFVSCMEDNQTFQGKTGSIYVINYQTNSVVTSIYAGHQSHGIAVDDLNKRVYITNRNVTNEGPTPHHSSVCNGRNGYVTAIDIATLQLIPGYKAEVSVDPYGAGITH